MHFSVPDLSSAAFWGALWKIMIANVILSGDNAVVIALASHGLPDHQRRPAIMFGSLGAIVMLIIFCGIVNFLLTIPYLKLVGGAMLLWIGIKLMTQEEEGAEGKIKQHGTLMAAVGTITLANTVMSLDNAIAIAAAAKGNTTLIVLGLIISIPLIIFGSTIILKLMTRFPVIITLGAALLGWVAGEMCLTDPAIHHWVEQQPHFLHYVVPALGAVLVVALGKWLASRAAAESEEAKAAGAEKPAH